MGDNQRKGPRILNPTVWPQVTPRHAPRAKCLHHCILLFITFDLICNMIMFVQNGFCPIGAKHLRPCPKGSHQNSECVPPVFIHRAVTCDSFKVLAKKAKEELGNNNNKKKRTQNPTFCPPMTPRCPQGKIFAPLYSTLHNLRFDMQQDYVRTKWILGPSRPHLPGPAPRGHIKIPNVFFHCSSIGLLPVTVSGF